MTSEGEEGINRYIHNSAVKNKLVALQWVLELNSAQLKTSKIKLYSEIFGLCKFDICSLSRTIRIETIEINVIRITSEVQKWM